MNTALVLLHLMVTCVFNDLSVHMKTTVDPEERVHGHVSITMGVTGVKGQKPSLPIVTTDTVTSVNAVRLFQYTASM